MLTSTDATIRAELGDGHQPVFPRSTLKLFQAQTALALGARLNDEPTRVPPETLAAEQGAVRALWRAVFG